MNKLEYSHYKIIKIKKESIAFSLIKKKNEIISYNRITRGKKIKIKRTK